MKILSINRQFFTIILVILALVGVNNNVRSEAYTIMLSQSDIKTSGSDNGKVVKKVPHATFTLASNGNNIAKGDDGGFRVWDDLPINTQKDVTLTWELDDEDNYQIEVTHISFVAKAYNSNAVASDNGKLSFNGEEAVVIGTASPSQYYGWHSTPFGGDGSYASGVVIKLINTAKLSKIRTFDYHFKNFEIQYAIKPVIKTTEDNKVAVTICDGNRQYLDLASCITNKTALDAHITSYGYELFGDNPAGGYISDNKFYAVNTGTYTVRIKAYYKDACHFTGYKLMTITVTPATLSLTAPTASDIIYHHTLGESVLTDGTASVGSCEVAGTWAWKDPSTAPEIGDAQPFAVVFTPSANKGNYTNFETTALVNVKRAQFIFDGSGSEADDPDRITWCYDDNWNENLKPGSEDEVRIEHNVVIRQEVSVYSVTINEGDTLTIMPTGGLTVGAGGITIAATGKLNLRAGTEGDSKGKTGYLRISPEYTGAMPEATVELYSKAYYDYNDKTENIAKWQYVGAPIADMDVMAKTVYKKSWIYSWNEGSEEWTNQRSTLKFTPFVGYATTQRTSSEGMLLTYVGQLVSNQGTNVVDLAYSGKGKGHNVLANSFSAPIDITKFTDDDFVNAEKAVYIFNTGSRRDAAAAEELKSTDAPGQYLSIPIGSAREMKGAFGLPTVIPSMQGFCVHATGTEARIRLNYERLVWDGNYEENPNAPARIPSHANVNTEEQVGALQLSIYANGWSDHLYMLESENFDTLYENGYDALKIMGDELNIFAIEDSAQLAVDATNSIVGTRVGVRTGEETSYTLVFSHLKAENALALLDNETEETIDINEGTEYTFFAEPNGVITERFQIVERANAPAVATGTENAKNGVKAQKFIKDGQLYVLKNGVLYNAMGAVVR